MTSKNQINRVALSLAICLALAFNDQVDAFAPPSIIGSASSNPHRQHQRSFAGANQPLHAFAMEPQAAMNAVDSFFQTQPYVAAFLTCSFKASAADMLAQTTEDKDAADGADADGRSMPSSATPSSFIKAARIQHQQQKQADDASSLDLSRNVGFLLYGGLYTGLAQNYLYTVLYPSWFGLDDGWTLVAKEVMLDNAVFAPLVCLPIAYAFKTAFTTGDFTLNALTSGLDKYIDDIMNRGLLFKYWSIWIPVQFLTFGVIPHHFQVAFVAFVSFFWICLLSSVSNAGSDQVDEPHQQHQHQQSQSQSQSQSQQIPVTSTS
mmetsp:Transcript_20558/g.58443  ORF Transcript_20558/g.58443 Transcript_20558/m.58443 type:complete len:320 (-) Transcript_20558:87-1046(-)|eukprot:CAMPEP_0119546650 /NCGR_PEP_ID=MMETSP1352-20130426/977_1 /TAXON_ID=265584 /ORGANISM="Stauroneis constricta, Strain CCMP1120" /LENGTH=319 /DNA_ID=CAMNT_0007591371 /DNA_START=34 /DNA_END=993 /DNA_ORIENTATION=-